MHRAMTGRIAVVSLTLCALALTWSAQRQAGAGDAGFAPAHRGYAVDEVAAARELVLHVVLRLLHVVQPATQLKLLHRQQDAAAFVRQHR